MRALLATIFSASLGIADSSSVSLSNGVQLRVGTATPTALKTDIQPASGNSFYRIFKDQNNLVVFAYELSVDRSPDGEQFRIRAMPAGSDFASKFPNADGGKPAPTLSRPVESSMIPSGGEFRIEIPTDPGLGETLTDVAHVQVNQRGAPVTTESGQSSAKIRFVSLRVRVNDNAATASAAGAVVSGKFAMFFIPGRGGYFFSIDAPDRKSFVQIGVVDGKRLHFTLENATYDCESDAPILTGSERGELWVYHDANYKPQGNWTNNNPANDTRSEFFTAAADSLNWWLP